MIGFRQIEFFDHTGSTSEIDVPWPSANTHQRCDEHESVQPVQGRFERLALFVIAELLCAGPGHEVKRFAVAVDDENVYFPLAVLIRLPDRDICDLAVC